MKHKIVVELDCETHLADHLAIEIRSVLRKCVTHQYPELVAEIRYSGEDFPGSDATLIFRNPRKEN